MDTDYQFGFGASLLAHEIAAIGQRGSSPHSMHFIVKSMFPQQEVLDKLGSQFRGCLSCRAPSLMMGSLAKAREPPASGLPPLPAYHLGSPWRNGWDHQSNKCQSRVQRNYWHSKKSSNHNCGPSKYSDCSESPRIDTENVRGASHWPLGSSS